MKYFVGVILFVILIIGVGAGSFYLGKKQVNLVERTPTPTPTSETILSPTPIATTTPKPPPTRDEVKDKIVAAFNSKSFANLQNLMAAEVVVILQATECCGPMTSADAVSQMSYLNSATSPWNFDDTNPIAIAIKTNNPENYGNSILGIATNNYVVAFQLNSENKISKISMAVHYNLLAP